MQSFLEDLKPGCRCTYRSQSHHNIRNISLRRVSKHVTNVNYTVKVGRPLIKLLSGPNDFPSGDTECYSKPWHGLNQLQSERLAANGEKLWCRRSLHLDDEKDRQNEARQAKVATSNIKACEL